MEVTLDRIDDVALNIKTFWFKPNKPVRYEAGQFTEFQLPLSKADERGFKHWFTLSSSPTEPLLGITTKFTPGKSSTFKDFLSGLRPGSRLSLAEPMGDFVLPKDKSIPLLFVAGGIGVTPVRSIIKWLADKDEKRDIRLIYAARQQQELAFTELFNGYPLDFTPIVTEPDPEWTGETGMLSAARIKNFIGDDPRALTYLSGPEPMVEQFVAELQELGVDYHRLVTDYFPGYESV